MAWTDERMDDLANHIDAGFERANEANRTLRTDMVQGFERAAEADRVLRADMNRGFDRVDARFERMEGDIHALRTLMTRVAIAMLVGLLGVIATLMGVIATGALSA